MLEKVRLTWIKGVLEYSLEQMLRIELGLTTRPDAVEHPFDLLVQRPEQPPKPLPAGTPICQIFKEAGQALLILGAPGTGKTTLLLELTRDLLDQAEQDEKYLIPVVFILSSWAEQGVALADWLVDELNKRYDVPRKLAKRWVDSNLILPLLDGLDEVAPVHREACVTALNTFISQHGLLPLVVCSRRAEYQALSTRLRLPSAVVIQPLTQQQVQRYLEQAGKSLTGLRAALETDQTLWELLDTPLMLSIMALSYQGCTAVNVQLSGTLEEQRKQLFAIYTDQMFKRRGKMVPYRREQTLHWLSWLAAAMARHNQSVFYLEWLQPHWLLGRRPQWIVTWGAGILSGLLLGLLFGLLSGLVYGPVHGLLFGLLFGLLLGLLGGLGGGLLFGQDVRLADRLGIGLVYGLGFGLIFWQLSGLLGGLGIGLGVGLGGVLAFMLSRGASSSGAIIQPAETLTWQWSPLKNGLLFGLLFGLLYGLVRGLFDALLLGLSRGLVFGVVYGLVGTLLLGLLFGLLYGLGTGLDEALIAGEITTRSRPNEGMWRSLHSALLSGLVGGLAGVLVFGLLGGLGGLLLGLAGGLAGGLFVGLFVGLGVGLEKGGRACLQHLILRFLLWRNNYAPWGYARFLDYAAERVFLRKVGGGYIFIHRMLLEYFAELDATQGEAVQAEK